MNVKKFLVFVVLLVALFVGGVVEYVHLHENDPVKQNHVATPQARASHMIGILDTPKDDEAVGHCTGTVIGPHAILTAEHCNKGKALQLDWGLRTYTIQKVLRDHRDHVIYLVNGPAFHDIQFYAARSGRVGEAVHLYGCGGKESPAHYKTGIVLDEYDPSEVDQAEGMQYYTIHSIPGDSGSAIYGEDNSIVGMVTYGITASMLVGERHYMAGFTLNFTPEQIKKAQKYQPKN